MFLSEDSHLGMGALLLCMKATVLMTDDVITGGVKFKKQQARFRKHKSIKIDEAAGGRSYSRSSGEM